MTLLQVTVSGTVGKQVFPASTVSSSKAKLCGVFLTPSGANATIKIREGNASGEVVFFGRATSAYGTKCFDDAEHYFTRGMHVKVIGTNAEAYLVLE